MSATISMRKLFLALVTIATCTAALAQEKEPIIVGTTASLSGHFEEFGVEQLRGLQMWADDVNARGQLLGRPVELKHYDDRSRDAGAIEGFTRLIEQDGADFLVGPYSSSLTLEASLVAERHDIPMVASAASSEQIWSRGLRNIFGIDTPAGSYLSGLSVARPAEIKTVALLYTRTEFGEEVAQGARQIAATDGLTLVVDEGHEPQQRDFSALAARLRVEDVDMIMGITSLEDSIALVQHLKQAGVTPNMMAFTVGPALFEFGDKLGADAEGVLGIVQWLRGVPLPGSEDFAYRYRQRYGHNPGVYAAIGYSAGQVIEAAVRLAGSTEPDTVREQLRSMQFRSLLGRYQVDETGRQIGKRNYLLQWQDGHRRLVAPENVAERTLVYPLP